MLLTCCNDKYAQQKAAEKTAMHIRFANFFSELLCMETLFFEHRIFFNNKDSVSLCVCTNVPKFNIYMYIYINFVCQC